MSASCEQCNTPLSAEEEDRQENDQSADYWNCAPGVGHYYCSEKCKTIFESSWRTTDNYDRAMRGVI